MLLPLDPPTHLEGANNLFNEPDTPWSRSFPQSSLHKPRALLTTSRAQAKTLHVTEGSGSGLQHHDHTKGLIMSTIAGLPQTPDTFPHSVHTQGSSVSHWICCLITQQKSATASWQCLLSHTACQLSVQHTGCLSNPGNGVSILSSLHPITSMPLTHVSKLSPALYLPVHLVVRWLWMFWGYFLLKEKGNKK